MVKVTKPEDDFWRAYSSYNSKRRNKSKKNNIVYKKFSNQPTTRFTSSAKTDILSRKNNHVMVKITGGASNISSIKNHFTYISRNNSLSLSNEEGLIFDYKEAVEDVRNEIENYLAREDSKKTYQIVFSTKGKNDPILLRKIVQDTVNQEFPNSKFFISVHDDTDNTHAHVVLMRVNKNQEKIEIRKSQLNSLKKTYSDFLNKNGIDSYFLSETDKQKFDHSLKSSLLKKKRENSNVYEILDFGFAPYKFSENGKPSFYMLLKNENGVIKEHWSLGLEKAITDSHVKRGDNIRLKKVNATGYNSEKDKFIRSEWNIEKIEKLGISSKQSTFKVVDYGSAKYKFRENGKPSYYLILQNEYGEHTDIWAKSLEAFLKYKKVKVGDFLTFNGTVVSTKHDVTAEKHNNITI